MNKLFISAILTLLNSHLVFSQYPVSANLYDSQKQRTGYWTILYDSTFHETSNLDSVVYYRSVRFEAGKPIGKVRDFYASGKKQWDGFLLSVNPDVVHGELWYYYENGKVSQHSQAGMFVEDKNSIGDNVVMNRWQAQQNPLLKVGLLLSGAANYFQDESVFSSENGILTAYEAANLNLENTDLVILSACETGKGEIKNGEGVYGMQRAFQTAGAKAIVMSLWKVDDNATQQLMTSFYTNWINGVEKQLAFKTAQMEIKKQFHKPYYWGAFVLVGN